MGGKTVTNVETELAKTQMKLSTKMDIPMKTTNRPELDVTEELCRKRRATTKS
jgi:hypothetical protein